MTYNRMEAKPIAGEHCRFCGDAKAPLVKTPCCQQWICCDTAFLSFRGGGRCQVEHERFSLCYSHYEDQHGGPWESCQKCRDFWSPRDYKTGPDHGVGHPMPIDPPHSPPWWTEEGRGISTDSRTAAHIERGFCPTNCAAAVVPSACVRKTLCTAVRHARLLGWSSL